MKKLIAILIAGILLFAAAGQGYERRVERHRGPDGRVTMRYNFRFRGRSYANPYYNRFGCSPYQGYGEYRYPGVDLRRYDMMPYYAPRYYVNPYYHGGRNTLDHWRH